MFTVCIICSFNHFISILLELSKQIFMARFIKIGSRSVAELKVLGWISSVEPLRARGAKATQQAATSRSVSMREEKYAQKIDKGCHKVNNFLYCLCYVNLFRQLHCKECSNLVNILRYNKHSRKNPGMLCNIILRIALLRNAF